MFDREKALALCGRVGELVRQRDDVPALNAKLTRDELRHFSRKLNRAEHDLSECAPELVRMLRAALIPEWRDRPPTVAEVRAHSEAHGFYSDRRALWQSFRENRAFFHTLSPGMGPVGSGTDWGKWRPCTPDGTPCAWPEVTS